VTTKTDGTVCCLRVATEPIQGFKNDERAISMKEEDSVGLTACEGILREHQGHISQKWGEDGALLLQVDLPVVQPVATTKEASVPVLWQSRPYA